MAEVIIEQRVNAPIREVWASWDRFGDIYQFNPNLSGSFHLDGSPVTGLGAERQCDLKDGKNYLRERVIDYVPERRLVIDIYETSLPLKSAQATFNLRPVGADQTVVEMKMVFQPGMGLLGVILTPLMKPVMRKMLGQLLKANSEFVETGTTVPMAA